MDNFNYKKYLAEGKLYENEEQGYTLYTTNVEYDNGKTGYMYQLVNSEDREENEIGFDQLYFDDEDNRLEMGVDFKDFDQGSFQEEEVSAEEAMKMYKSLAEGKILREEMELEFFNNDEDVALIANSGEYEAEIKDGKVSFSVAYEDEDDRDGMEFSENNWKSILGPNHAFVEVASKIPTEVEAIDDYVMITVNLEDLKGIASLAEGKLLKEADKFKSKKPNKMKKETVDSKLAEIEKQSQVVALEAKIAAIDEMIESKNQRISMVTEDDNLSQLVDKKKMKEMQREVKDLERRKAKMEKLYEKMCGKSYTKEEIVDEEMSTELNEGRTKMKKSELKEMIKSAMMAEAELTINDTTDAYDPLYEEEATEVFTDAELDMASEMLMDMFDKLGLENNVEKSDALVKYINSWFETNDFVNEAEEEDVEVEDEENVDVDIEKDVKVDDKSVETDIDVKGSMPGEGEDEIAVQSLLMKAQEEAEKLGDEKLTDQIGNTITYFTRAHVATVDTNESINESTVRRGNDGLINKLL